MIPKGNNKSIVSNANVPRLNMLATDGTREKAAKSSVRTDSAARTQSTKSVRTQRNNAEKAVAFDTDAPTLGTERKAKREPAKIKKATKLLRQQSETRIGKIEQEKEKKNNKKEKPSAPLQREKSSTSLFRRKSDKKPAPTIQSAAEAVRAETAKVKPPTHSVNCCRNILLIFKEEQFKHLRVSLEAHCMTVLVNEQHAFLKDIAQYSNDHLPTLAQARQLIATYGTPGQPLFLNIENNDPWGAAAAALDRNDLQGFFDVVMGGDLERANDESTAILPQLALGLEQKYLPFVKAHS